METSECTVFSKSLTCRHYKTFTGAARAAAVTTARGTRGRCIMVDTSISQKGLGRATTAGAIQMVSI